MRCHKPLRRDEHLAQLSSEAAKRITGPGRSVLIMFEVTTKLLFISQSHDISEYTFKAEHHKNR